MSKLARTLLLVAMVAAMNLAAMAAVAQAPTRNDPTGTPHRGLGQPALLATDQPSGQAEATVRRLLARERSSLPGVAPTHPRLPLDKERSSLRSLPNRDPATRAALAQERYHSTWGYGGTPAEPSGQPTWLVIALAVLVAVLALVAGVAMLTTRRASRSHHAGQTA